MIFVAPQIKKKKTAGEGRLVERDKEKMVLAVIGKISVRCILEGFDTGAEEVSAAVQTARL